MEFVARACAAIIVSLCGGFGQLGGVTRVARHDQVTSAVYPQCILDQALQAAGTSAAGARVQDEQWTTQIQLAMRLDFCCR